MNQHGLTWDIILYWCAWGGLSWVSLIWVVVLVRQLIGG